MALDVCLSVVKDKDQCRYGKKASVSVIIVKNIFLENLFIIPTLCALCRCTMSKTFSSKGLPTSEAASLFTHLRPLWATFIFVGELAFFMTIIVIVYRFISRDIRTSLGGSLGCVFPFFFQHGESSSAVSFASLLPFAVSKSVHSDDNICRFVLELLNLLSNALVSEVLWLAILFTCLYNLYITYRGWRVLSER